MSLIVTVSVIPTLAFAAPGIPHQFYGNITYTNGTTISSGNVIVKIGTTQIATVQISSGKYGYNPNLLLVTDSDSNRTGSTLKFFIDNVDTGKTAIFTNGGYTELNLTTTVPNDTITGNDTNIFLSSTNTGEANMPTGTTNIVLANTTALDLSSSKISQSSTKVMVGGSVVALTQSVTLQSGINNQPIILTNSNVSNVSASIPDGTKIQGPAEWDGKIMPPVAGSSSGIAPTGFSVGATISIGSPDVTLVFDNPVTILFTNVTGAMGYKPAGLNTWVQITNVCDGSYASPIAPVFPGECYISNGTNTKIYTYHFTTFGSLTANLTPVPTAPSRGGSGSYSSSVVGIITDTNNDGKINILDFVALMANWGKTGIYNVADFNRDGNVSILDFVLLMANWTI